MLIKNSSEKIFTSEDFTHVSILILITLCLGVFLIATTVVIARDGTIFIAYAKEIGISPVQTMLQEYQHPGYPFLILAASKITGLFYKGSELFRFIYSAQAAALFFRILAIIVLYFLGKELVGARYSFQAILILVLLPKPAEYGSDALSDWPTLFFLSAGMLMLFYGAKFGKWWMFELAGLAGGLGYLVRPEGAQVVIYGVWWLILQLFWKKRTLNKLQASLGLVSMLIIFLVIVSPYMKLKGGIFPKKDVGTFSSAVQSINSNGEQTRAGSPLHEMASIVPSKIAAAVKTIFENAGDTLMWFFLIPYFIGIFLYFKKHRLLEANQFLIIALVIINVPLMIWLYSSYGYMSVRHTLPLVVFTMFFIPTGLNAWASWFNMKFSRGFQHTHRWFAILMTIGIAICIPKLFSSLHPDKLSFRDAALWLSQNTESSAIIAVPDYRVSFYAERKGIIMTDGNVPEAAQYIVKISGKKTSEREHTQVHNFREVCSMENNTDKQIITIYKRTGQ